REVFPITSMLTKLIELAINAVILAALMAWYRMIPSAEIVWAPLIIIYTMIVALAIPLAGAAINVYYRDVGTALPVMLSLLMYASPVIYPLQLVKDKLLVQHAAGGWSEAFYVLYTLNPLAGIIQSFQNVVLRGEPPDWVALLPGAVLGSVALPLSYWFFKRAEAYFADVICRREVASSMSSPSVSVLVPAYNGEKFLGVCLDSVLAQTYQDWELVIVDDCSTDATRDIAEAYALRDSRVRV